MKATTRITNTPDAGTFAYLQVTDLTEKVARVYLTEHAGVYYADIFGKGRTETLARAALAKKVQVEIARLEAKGDRRSEYKLRLELLRSFAG